MRRWFFTLVLAIVAGCGSDDARTLADTSGSRSECPDSTWTDGFFVSPVELVAGSDQSIDVSWEVFDQVRLPAEAVLSVTLDRTELVLTIPLSGTQASLDTVMLEGSAANPFGAALAGRTVQVLAQSQRLQGCAEGAAASSALTLSGP